MILMHIFVKSIILSKTSKIIKIMNKNYINDKKKFILKIKIFSFLYKNNKSWWKFKDKIEETKKYLIFYWILNIINNRFHCESYS